MNRIKSVSMDRWKGQTGTFELTPLTILTGPNGCGKTARLEAIKWACTGTSILGRKPESAAGYGDETGCKVRVSLASGESWERSLTRATEGSVSQDLRLDGSGRIGSRESAARLAKVVGDFMPMWDLSEFLALSPEKRRDFVLRLCSQAAPKMNDTVSIRCEIETVAGLTLTDLGDGRDGLLTDCVREIIPSNAFRPGDDLAGQISNSVFLAKDLQNSYRTKIRDNKAAIDRLGSRIAEIAVNTESAEAIQNEIAKLNREAGKIRAQIEKFAARGKDRCKLAQKATAAISIWDEAKDALACLVDDDVESQMAEALTLEQQAADLDKQIAAIDTSDGCDELRKRLDKLASALDGEYTAFKTADDAKSQAELRAGALAYKINAIEASGWPKAMELCDKAFEESQWVASDLPALGELRSFCKEQCEKDELTAIRDESDSLKRNIPILIDRWSESMKRLTAIRDEMAAVKNEMQVKIGMMAATNLELSRLKSERDHAFTEAEQTRGSLVERQSEISALSEKVDRLKASADEAKAALDAFDKEEPIDHESLSLDLRQIGEQIDAYTQQSASIVRRSTLESELNIERENLTRCEFCEVCCGAIRKALQAKRETLMKDLVLPLLSWIDRFYGGLGGARAFCDLEDDKGSPCFDLGLHQDGKSVSLDSMSGGESVIFSAALTYALVMLADPPLKVLLVEAAEVDGDCLFHLTEALNAVAGDVGNIIVATCAQISSVDGWDVVSLWPVYGLKVLCKAEEE